MAAKKEVTIYGGGMSGMIAAINLARDGHKVVIHEREPDFGGDSIYNPSTHATPIDVKRTSEYIGIDISPVFNPLIAFPVYFHDTKINIPPEGFYAVERGRRPSSLDTLLFQEAVKEGVDFQFNSPLKQEKLKSLPPNTIIACGLTPSVYDMLDVPHLRWYGWISRGEFALNNYCWVWMDECVTEYGYLSSANNYYFENFFSRRPVSKEALEKYKDFMKRNENVVHEGEWKYVSGAVPIGSSKNPRLTHNGLILCGTIAGYMDPMFWFGILGAIVSGKVAALAITDPQRAEQDFNRFNRLFAKYYFVKNNIWYKLRPHVNFLEGLVKVVGVKNVDNMLRKLMKKHRPFSIPGFAHLGSD